MATAIAFEHISKQYRLGLVSTKTLSHDLRRFWITNVLGKEDPYLKIGEVNDRSTKGQSDYVWALRDIDFKVEQGDVLGIIGKNGAGKSTLLKLLSKVTGPTTGTIRARGRIGSLLEVGTGFHPEMTGRENIFLNGAILGMTRHEIQRKLDEIIDFSGCERYIDTPVKRYSSGMMVRLGFAVAAFLEPEILVVDEVLAVGDAEFQKKAIGKMQDVSKGEGRTVLFVSHNMASVKKLCTKGVLLENGQLKFMGGIEETIDEYLSDSNQAELGELIKMQPLTSSLEILDFTINGQRTNYIEISPESKNEIVFNVKGCAYQRMKLALEALLFDNNGVLLGKFSPSHLQGKTAEVQDDFEFCSTLRLPINMTRGQFKMQVDLTYPNVEYLARMNVPLIVSTSGIVGESGINFEYNGSGLLML